jgi:hypothetical protein
MRLKSKAVALVALMVLTATPRVFDQMAELKNRAAAKFRTELLNVFWSFTTPEAHSADAARQYSELLARAQEAAPRCDSSDEIRTPRVARAMSGPALSQAPANDLGHRQPFAFDEPTTAEHLSADVATARSEQPLAAERDASLNGREDVALVARNFRDYPVFDEFAAPVAIDDAVAQFELSRTDETSALPQIKPATYTQRAFPGTKRFMQKFVDTNVQFQLPENLGGLLNSVITNTDALIKGRDALAPPKPKCRVRVLRLAPEAPRPLEKPAMIS